MTDSDQRAAIIEWHDARLAVASADTRQKFLAASTDLWEAETRLMALGWALRDDRKLTSARPHE